MKKKVYIQAALGLRNAEFCDVGIDEALYIMKCGIESDETWYKLYNVSGALRTGTGAEKNGLALLHTMG